MSESPLGEADDIWLTERRWIIDPKKLHAIGWITMAWAVCEEFFHALFALVAGLSFETGRAITHKMGNETLAQTIRDVCKTRMMSDDFIENISYIVKFYGICRDNRNFLAHASLGHASLEPSLVKTSGPFATR